MWTPCAEGHLQLVREFLRREFRDCSHRDYSQVDPPAQVFIIETEHNVRRTLVIPKVTFEVVDFPALCNAELVDVLKAARGGRITLTPEGPCVHE
jgi:hypothetical protein